MAEESSTRPWPAAPAGALRSGVAVEVSAAFTWSGVQEGWAWRRRATSPEVTAVASDVPLPFM